MTDHELDARFEEAAKLLTREAWEREPLFTLAQAVAVAKERGEQHGAELRALRDHIRQRATEIRASLEQLLEEVPCTIHARILYMELLTGYPELPGNVVDNGTRASELVRSLVEHLAYPWKEARGQYNERLEREGALAAKAHEDHMQLWNHFRREAASRDLKVEALRIFQQLQEAGERWMKRPGTNATFKDYFSTEQWTRLNDAITSQGLEPKPRKGKNELVAALHAAFVRYEVHLPNGTQWLELLRNTYPSVPWNPGSKTLQNPVDRKGNKGYEKTYRETLALLR